MNDDAVLAELDRMRAHAQRWVAVDVAAVDPAAQSIAEAVARASDDVAADAANVSRPPRWWFLRKPPGVRVRIEAPTTPESWSVAAKAALSSLGPAVLSVYEPERYRFGGDVGMDVAHDQFALDSTLAARYERISDHLVKVHWSAWLLDDLCLRLVDDPAEAWDAWKRLEDSLATVVDKPGRRRTASSETSADTASQHLQRAGQQGNAMVAARLRQAQLRHGIARRAWFGAVSVFHWNRLGFQPEQMQQVVAEALDRFENHR